MYEFLEKLKPVYCDDCNVSCCCESTKYCEADMINAYQQGRADALKEFYEKLMSRVEEATPRGWSEKIEIVQKISIDCLYKDMEEEEYGCK